VIETKKPFNLEKNDTKYTHMRVTWGKFQAGNTGSTPDPGTKGMETSANRSTCKMTRKDTNDEGRKEQSIQSSYCPKRQGRKHQTQDYGNPIE